MKKRVVAMPTEVYSRVVGYYRPVQNWNDGKRREFSSRYFIGSEKQREFKREGKC